MIGPRAREAHVDRPRAAQCTIGDERGDLNAGAFEQGHQGHFIASDRRSGRADLKFLSDTRWDGHPESVPGWLTPTPWTCVRRTLDLVKHIHTLPPYCPYLLPQLFGSSLCAEGAETYS